MIIAKLQKSFAQVRAFGGHIDSEAMSMLAFRAWLLRNGPTFVIIDTQDPRQWMLARLLTKDPAFSDRHDVAVYNFFGVVFTIVLAHVTTSGGLLLMNFFLHQDHD